MVEARVEPVFGSERAKEVAGLAFLGHEVGLDHNALDFVETDLVGGAVVQLGRPWRFACGDLLRVLHRAAIFQVGRDADGAPA